MTRLLRRAVVALILPVTLIAVWWWTSRTSDSPFYPPASSVLSTLGPTWFTGRFSSDVIPSLTRLFIGYGLALVLGVGAGVGLGLSPRARAFVEPTAEFFRAIPPPVLVPVIALFTSFTGSTSKVVAITLGCLWPVLLNTIVGVRSIDPDLVDTGRAFRLSRRAQLTNIVLPASSPQIVTGARQALSIGVILMVISELFGASNGIGYAIVQFQRSFDIPQMWSGIIVLGLLGVVLAGAFHLIERRLLRWHTGIRDASR